MNYFELYPGDYLRDTTRLGMNEHGAYMLLLLTYYSEEAPMPSDEQELFTIAKAKTAADRAAVRKVIGRYFKLFADGFYHHSRADEDIIKAHRRIKIARENGSKNKSKDNQLGNPLGMPAGKPDDTQQHSRSGEALHTPPNQLKEEAKEHVPQAARFAEFWQCYPIKRGRKPAEAKWRQKRLDAVADDLIADVTRRVRGDQQWRDGFAPHAAKYLHQELWTDELAGRKAVDPPRPSAQKPADLVRRDPADHEKCNRIGLLQIGEIAKAMKIGGVS